MCGQISQHYLIIQRKDTPHPTQKPIKLIERIIQISTNEGDLILDNCMGSGTTACACINTNRNFIGFEVDKEYYEYAEKRIKDMNNNQKKMVILTKYDIEICCLVV